MDELVLYFTKDEIEDLLANLDQCQSEGYLNYGDPAYSAMHKLKDALVQYGRTQHNQ